MKRVLICGDRNWWDKEMIYSILSNLHHREEVEVVIEGEARGADTQGRIAAERLGVEVLKFPAEWDKYGRGAGPIRNRQMVCEGKPDLVLAFHDNLEQSRGTKDMIEFALKSKIEVRLYQHDHEPRIFKTN